MKDGGLVRLKYYRGQMLTAQDFEDQQEYHRRKQHLLLRRFPSGIIGGLEVICEPKSAENPADFDGFLIQEGSAVDSEGNELVVPKSGLKVPTTEFNPDPESENHYLSLVYDEQKDFVGGDVCGGSSQKNNRIKEGVKAVWDPSPNMHPHVTVALIQLKDPNDAGTTCDKFKSPMETSEMGTAPVRINARVVDAEQLTDGAVTEKKIKNGAVKADKIAAGAVITEKLFDGAVTDKKLALDAVIEEKIKNKAVTADKLNTDAVVEEKIKDAAVTENKIFDGAVTENKINDGAITEDKIRDGAVTEDKILNEAVTEDKIKDDAVTESKIENAAVTENKIFDGAVTENKINDGAVTEDKIRDGAVTGFSIKNEAVTENKIADGAVTSGKLKLLTDLPRTDLALPNVPVVITDIIISENSIVSVVPVIDPSHNPPDGRELSWTSTVKTTNQVGMVNHTVTVTAVGEQPVAFKVKVIAFNAPEQP